MSKVSVNVHQHTKQVTVRDPSKHQYEVVKVTNATNPYVGQILSEEEVNALVGRGITVNIEKSKR